MYNYSLQNYAWYAANSNETTHPVGQLSPNRLYIYDMSGNVSEWCNDWRGNYTSEHLTNPTGPQTGTYRIVRGGHYNCDKIDEAVFSCLVWCRGYPPSNNYMKHIGLRLAK